jgi:hypothetical protein
MTNFFHFKIFFLIFLQPLVVGQVALLTHFEARQDARKAALREAFLIERRKRSATTICGNRSSD